MSSMLGLAPTNALAPPAAPPAPLPILARSLAAAGSLGLEVLAGLLTILFCRVRIDIIDRLIAKTPVSSDEIAASDGALVLLSRVPIGLFVLSAVTFLLCFHRANANLRAFRADMFQFTPRDAVLSFIIPFISLYRPPAVMSEIWRASDPGIPPFAERPWTTSKRTVLVPLWWTLFLVRGLAGSAWTSAADSGDGNLASIRTLAVVFAVTQVINIGAALPAILLIAKIQRRQESLKEQLALPPPSA